MEKIAGEFFPSCVFSDHERLEAYVAARGGTIDGKTYDVEEIDLDPEPKK